MLAGIDPAITAGGTLAAVGIGIDGDGHAWLQTFRYILADTDYLGTYLMTWYDRHLHHRVATTVGAEVTTAETYIFHSQ